MLVTVPTIVFVVAAVVLVVLAVLEALAATVCCTSLVVVITIVSSELGPVTVDVRTTVSVDGAAVEVCRTVAVEAESEDPSTWTTE